MLSATTEPLRMKWENTVRARRSLLTDALQVGKTKYVRNLDLTLAVEDEKVQLLQKCHRLAQLAVSLNRSDSVFSLSDILEAPSHNCLAELELSSNRPDSTSVRKKRYIYQACLRSGCTFPAPRSATRCVLWNEAALCHKFKNLSCMLITVRERRLDRSAYDQANSRPGYPISCFCASHIVKCTQIHFKHLLKGLLASELRH